MTRTHESQRVVGASSKEGSPTTARRGTVTRELTEYEACECGGMRMVGPGAHAPRLTSRGVVDCMGRIVRSDPS